MISKTGEETQDAKRRRTRAMLTIAALCGPCCIPLIAGPLMGLVAGTPLAAVLGMTGSWAIAALALAAAALLGLTAFWLLRRQRETCQL